MVRCAVIWAFVSALVFGHADADMLPAFPGAEGFGAVAVGGRGGDVYHVTTLADSGTGSLRHGIESAEGPRTIVFDLSGTIELTSRLRIDRPFLTIAGQTAPGDGICIRDYSIDIRNTHDVVLRYLRVRRGDLYVRDGTRPTTSAGLDVISIDDSKNVILDHCSLSWSCDEILGIVQNENVTVQWCIISEPLGDPALHPYGDNHAYGANNSATTLSYHHNLFATYVMRGPQFEANDADTSQGYDVHMESVNNVLFNYTSSGSRYTAGIEDYPERAVGIDFFFHFVNNYYRRYRYSGADDIQVTPKHGVSPQVKAYVSGNISPARPTDDLDQWTLVEVEKEAGIREASADLQAQMSDTALFTTPIPVTMEPAGAAYQSVLATAGCSIVRDSVDQRVVREVIRGIYRDPLSTQNRVGGWPRLGSAPAPTDTDADGMPDEWEQARGLDETDAADRNDDPDGDGYTNLEDYLNGFEPTVYPTGLVPREAQPQGLRLGVSPNPFNATATVRYRLPQRSYARLDVYTVNGQRIATLADRQHEAGEHSLSFGGAELASGVYVLRLSSGVRTVSARASLVK